MIQKRDAKIVVTPIFNMFWVTLKRRIIIEQIKPHLYRFCFCFFSKRRLNSKIRWCWWHWVKPECEFKTVKSVTQMSGPIWRNTDETLSFYSVLEFRGLYNVGTSFSVWDSICKSWNENYFFPWSFFIVDSKYLHIFLVCWFTNEFVIVLTLQCTYFHNLIVLWYFISSSLDRQTRLNYIFTIWMPQDFYLFH